LGIISDTKDLTSFGLNIPLLKLLTVFKQDRLKIYFEGIRDCRMPLPTHHEKKEDGLMGQLSIKEEAAGKVRVFALVDV